MFLFISKANKTASVNLIRDTAEAALRTTRIGAEQDAYSSVFNIFADHFGKCVYNISLVHMVVFV